MTWYCDCLQLSRYPEEGADGAEPFDVGDACLDCGAVLIWDVGNMPHKLTEPEVCKALEAPMFARLLREGYRFKKIRRNVCPSRCKEDHRHVRVPKTRVFADGNTKYREAIHLPARDDGIKEVLVFERKENAKRTRTEVPLSSSHKKQLNFYALLNKKFSGVPSPQESEYLLSRKL